MPRIHGPSPLRRGLSFLENDLSEAAQGIVFKESKLIKRLGRPGPGSKGAHIGHQKGAEAESGRQPKLLHIATHSRRGEPVQDLVDGPGYSETPRRVSIPVP